jgi:hypothetical protein
VSYIKPQQYPTKYVLPIRERLETGQTVYGFTVADYDEIFPDRKVPGKKCLANLCPEIAAHTTIVRLIKTDQDGKRISQNLHMGQLISALHSFDEPQVPLWTTSSGKNGTYYFVPTYVYEKLVDSLGIDRETGAEKFASYIGLLYSDVTGNGCWEVPALWEEPLHGEDGNCVGRFTGQFRAMSINDEGYPCLLGKGISNEVISMHTNPRGFYLNSTQIKVAAEGVKGHARIIIAPTAVTDKPIRTPATWELIELLQDVPEVRKVLAERVQQEVSDILDMLKEGNRVKLLQRLGQLRLDDNGKLLETDRNVLSALRANVPWCAELETRLGRVFIDEITGRIAPSGGVFAWSYLATQHDKLGAKACSWDDDVQCIAFRVPCTSIDNVVPFDRVLRKGLVHPDVMAAMDGDSDGDRINVISDPEIVALFKNHRLNFRAGHKPEKARNQSRLTVDRMIDLAIQTYDDLAGVGSLTMAMHAHLAAGNLDKAAFAGWLAQLCPMLLKWDVKIAGREAREVIRAAQGAKLPGISWRAKQKEAKELETPRDLYHLGIRENRSIIDYCWNVMVRTTRQWVNDNPLKELSLPSVARLTWTANPGMRISGADMRWRKEVVGVWGRYWNENFGKDMPHADLYNELEAMGESATIGALAELLMWTPQAKELEDGTIYQSTGFALKWHVLGRRWEEVLGLRDEVQDYVMSENIDHEMTVAIQAAVREAMGLGYAQRVTA